jgi:hypothetical protein
VTEAVIMPEYPSMQVHPLRALTPTELTGHGEAGSVVVVEAGSSIAIWLSLPELTMITGLPTRKAPWIGVATTSVPEATAVIVLTSV